MIKLENLHQEDIIYQVYKYHWISKIKIIDEFKLFEYQSIDAINNHTEIYHVEGLSTLNLNENNFTDFENLYKDDEISLYKTFNEAKKAYSKAKQNRISYLQKDNNLINELYKKAICTGILTDADKKIFKELIDKCAISFNNKNN